MIRKTLRTVAITGFLSLLSVVTVFADPTPTNDTTKKIKLSTSAVDNIDVPSDLYFAWYYNKPQSDGTFLKVQLSENTDTTDETNFGTPFVKGEAGSSIIITQEKYGNGVYIAECRDSNGNLSSEKIELLAWDTNGPANITYQVTPDNTTPSSHKSIRILATDASDGDGGLAEKPYAIYGPAEESFYNESISGKTNAEIVSFIEEKRASEPTKMSDWTDSVLTVDKEGYYVLFVKDTAGNISHSQAQIKKIDVISPEIGALDVSFTSDGTTVSSYNNEMFNSETKPALVTLEAPVTDNCSSSANIKYSWYKEGGLIAEGVGMSKLYISPLTKDSLGTIIGGEELAKIQDNSAIYNAGDGSTTGGAISANGQYKVVVEDECGNKATSEILILSIFDFTVPTFDNPTIDTSEAVKSNTIRVSNTADNIKLAASPLIYHKQGEEGTPTTNVIYLVSENGTYEIDLLDAAGNKTTKTVTVDNIDNITPVITGCEFANNEGTVQLTVDATDKNLAGSDTTDRLQYCLEASSSALENSTAWQDSNIIDSFGGNPLVSGTYWLGVKDRAGNITFQSISINAEYISGSLETMTSDKVLSYIEQSPTGWTNGNVQLTVSLPAGLTNPLYSFNSVEDADYSTSNKKSFGGNGSVVVRIKDEYGNVYPSDPFYINNIDKTSPVGDVRFKDETKNTAIFTLTDNAPEGETAVSGIDKLTLCVTNNGLMTESVIYDELSEEVASLEVEWPIPQNGTYAFKVYDNAGNVCALDVTFDGAIASNSELTSTTLAMRVTQYPATYTTEDVKLQLILNDTSDLAEKPFRWGYVNKLGIKNEVIDPVTGEITYENNDEVLYLSDEFTDQNYTTATSNGLYFVVVKDKYGHETQSDYIKVSNIDRYSPGQSMEPIDIDESGTVSLTLDDVPYRGNVPIGYAYTDDASSGLSKITMIGGSYSEETIIKEFADRPKNATVSVRVPVIGTYIFKVYDAVGNVSQPIEVEVTHAVTDNEEINDPEVLKSKIVSDSANMEWTAGPVRLAVNLASFEGLAANPFKWSNQSEYSNVNYVDVTENGDYTVTVKDVYGNENVSSAFTVANIDATQPTILLSKSADGTKLNYNVSDSQSGIMSVTWEGGALETLTPIRAFSNPQSEVNGSVPFPNNGDYVVTVTDYCGNSASANISVENISAPNPLLDTTPEGISEGVTTSVRTSPTGWTNGNVIVSVDMPNKTGVDPNGYLWSSDAPVSEETKTYIGLKGNRTSIVVTDNGAVKVTVTDEYGTEFNSDAIVIDNIDKTSPDIDASLSEDGTKIVVNATDELSGISRLLYTIDGAGETTVLTLSAFASDISREVPVSNNGTYLFTVYDNAGNSDSFEIVVTTAATGILNDAYISSNIKFGTSDKTNQDVTITVDIPDKSLLTSEPYSWDNGATWTNDASYVCTDNGTYNVLVKDKYDNIYTGTAVVSNIDRSDPVLNLFQNGNKLQITAGDNSQISKVTMNRPNDRYEETIKEYSASSTYDVFSVDLTENGVYTVSVYDSAGNKLSREINIEGVVVTEPVGNENSGDTTAPATDIILINKDTTETQNPTATTGNTSSSGNVVKEYHYDTKEKTSIVTVDRPVSSGSSSASSYAPRYTTPVPTYNYPATTASSMPAVKITPTPTPVPTTVKNTTSTTSSTAKPVSTTSNVSTTAKKVSPSKTTSVVTTTKTTETTLDKANAGVEEESADAKTMYRNNRVEQTSGEDTSKKKDPKVGLIIFGSVLGIALLGVGIYAFTKRKEQKKIAE